MLLSLPRIAATLTSLGETEASSAGEQLAKGYPSRAVTALRRGRPSGLPTPLLSAYASKKLPPKAERIPMHIRIRRPRQCGKNFRKNVAKIPGTRTCGSPSIRPP